MDFVYIDEVQDLSMRQISLFKYICKNVDEGFVFSGDTAQTIARGIDFRFEDIRSLFYTEFLKKSGKCEVSGTKERGLISDMFNLSQNFRTHTGVLMLAQSVIDLICHYFPQSIDSLAPETSLIYGECPVVLEPGSDENLIMSIFGHGGKDGGKWVGFGADQVILVRDDSVRKEISGYIGQQALILTILECKGLEFQDVLLYNFFGSSPLGNQWRVLYEFLNEKNLDFDSPKSYPCFSQSRHTILCSELKQLYVAITRTRQRLWICESSEEFSKPMLDYWRRLCLVQVTKIDDSLAKAMQRVSTHEEWKSQGIKLFTEKNYEMAVMCFEKAGEEKWEKRAKASGLKAAADSLHGSNPEQANIMLREAAEIFDSIDRVESAAQCFWELGDYERAGRIYLEKCGMSELRKAGECFCRAGNYKTAAEVYWKGNFFRECLSACSKGKLFDIGLQYIEYWKRQAPLNSVIMARLKEIDKIAQEFLENCALECHKANDNKSLMKFVRAFNTTKAKRNFLKSLDCLEGLMVLEEELGNFSEAAEIAKSLGNVVREIDLLERAEQFAKACLLILSYVLSNCLWASRSRGWPLKSFPQKVELVNRAISIAQKVSEAFNESISGEVKIFLYEQRNMSEWMYCYNVSRKYDNPIGEIFSVRKLLDKHFLVDPTEYESGPELLFDPRPEERILRNQVSCGTLFYLWNLWKAKCLSILESLHGLEKSDFIKSEGTVGFCLNYFGVRLVDNFNATFHLMNPDAYWVRNVDKGFVRQTGKVMTLDARHFSSAARKHWHQELVNVGIGVLEALKNLYNHLSKNCRSVCLLQVFDISKFFLESKSINKNNLELRKLQGCVQLSTNYFSLVFPLDPQEFLSANMISLRETEISKNLLEEIVSRNIDTPGELSYGQIGRLAMIMLGNPMPKHGLFDRIAEKLSKDTSWNSFFENLRAFKSAEALSREFHKALEETYNVHWRASGYISPNCFFYLVERLLILASCSQSHLFASKSSFVQYLMCLPSEANPGASLVSGTKSDSNSIFNFIIKTVVECLSNNIVTSEWIKFCNIDCESYFPVLMVRLLVILCVSLLNSGASFKQLFDLLRQPYIRSQLPFKFCEALRSRRPNVAAVATAFKIIGDPLVILSSCENNLKHVSPDAVFLDWRSFPSKDDIMKKLFPSHVEPLAQLAKSGSSRVPPAVIDQAQSDVPQSMEPLVAPHAQLAKSGSSSVPPIVIDQAQIDVPQSMGTLGTDTKFSSGTGNRNQLINWGLIRELSDVLGSPGKSHDHNFKSLVLEKKAEMKVHLDFLADAMANHTSFSGEDKDAEREAPSITEILNRLSLFCTSDFDIKALPEARELFKSLEARQHQLDMFFSLLTTDDDPNGGDVSGEIDDCKVPNK